MSSLSLQKSIQGCKVVTDWAPRIQSDRFLNSQNLMCPLWSGFDLVGRSVCPDSFQTKVEGCNDPLDRVMVENEQRPKYFQYLTLNANGLEGGGDSSRSKENYNNDMNKRSNMIRNLEINTPQYGSNLNSLINTGGCSVNSYERSMASDNQNNRYDQALHSKMMSQNNRNNSGMY